MKATAMAPTGPALPLKPQLGIVDGARAIGGENQFQIDRFRGCLGGQESESDKDCQNKTHRGLQR
jgi:hypothetical protein